MGCISSKVDLNRELQSDPEFEELRRRASENEHVLQVSRDGIIILEPIISGLAIRMRGPSSREEIPKVIHEIRIVLAQQIK